MTPGALLRLRIQEQGFKRAMPPWFRWSGGRKPNRTVVVHVEDPLESIVQHFGPGATQLRRR